MTVRVAIAISLGVLGTVSCGSVTFPDRNPAIEGEIVGFGSEVPFARGNERAIWVKEEVTDECGIVFDTFEAEIGETRPDGSVKRRGFDDLAVGQQVRVWAINIADSCPGSRVPPRSKS